MYIYFLAITVEFKRKEKTFKQKSLFELMSLFRYFQTDTNVKSYREKNNIVISSLSCILRF